MLITKLSGTEASYMPVPEVFVTDVCPIQPSKGSFLEPAAGDKLAKAAYEMIRKMQ